MEIGIDVRNSVVAREGLLWRHAELGQRAFDLPTHLCKHLSYFSIMIRSFVQN